MPRQLRDRYRWMLALLVLALPQYAYAETAVQLTAGDQPGATPEPPPAAATSAAPEPFRLGAAAGINFGVGDVWQGGGGDEIRNEGSPMFWELTLEAMYRLAPDFSLGVRAGVGLEPGSRGIASSSGERLELGRELWQLGAAGRYQPQPGRSWYLTVHAGAAGIVDHVGEASVSQWTQLFGAAVGYDLRLIEPVALGIELRGAYAPFGESDPLPIIGSIEYETTSWFGLALVGNLSL